jgi:hypothetical protein
VQLARRNVIPERHSPGSKNALCRRHYLCPDHSVLGHFTRFFLYGLSPALQISARHPVMAAGAMSVPTPSAPPPESPSLPWRFTSSLIMGLMGSISRGFLYGLNSLEVIGLDRFLETLDKRSDIESRSRGLITGTRPNCY